MSMNLEEKDHKAMNIQTKYDPPPIPLRASDWSAWDDATYEPGCAIGWGSTEAEAIDNLLEQLQ